MFREPTIRSASRVGDGPQPKADLHAHSRNSRSFWQFAVWDLPDDPQAVAQVRADVAARLGEWHLGDLKFTTELIVSELVTKAIRYGGKPICLRLIRDTGLICEVSDGSRPSRMRRARTTDEGGWGLFLMAQLGQRWGTRYTTSGKVIWVEQPLPWQSGAEGR